MAFAPLGARSEDSPPREGRPGRTCPLSYRYAPHELAREPQVRADTLYVVGGLYGNVEALEALLELAACEPGGATIVFNGDFHWFDVAPADFECVAQEVLLHPALRGNVETELAGEESGAGCGCAYPADVSDADVSRSNAILCRLRETARAFPHLREHHGELPMHLTAQVGDARVGIVHGDAASLAGWGFARDRLDDPAHRRWIESVFQDARVDAFASSHTCLPACRAFDLPDRRGIIINNGAAGMANFAHTTHGIVTRISIRPPKGERLYGSVLKGIHLDAVPLRFDAPRWIERFLAAWPEGSPAHASYFSRIAHGPNYSLEQAAA